MDAEITGSAIRDTRATKPVSHRMVKGEGTFRVPPTHGRVAVREGKVIAVAVLLLALVVIAIPLLVLRDDERLPEQRPTVVRTDDMTWQRTPSPVPSSQPRPIG